MFRVEEISIRMVVISVASAVGSVAWRAMKARERFVTGSAVTWAVAATTALLMDARAWVMASPAAALSASELVAERPAVVESEWEF